MLQGSWNIWDGPVYVATSRPFGIASGVVVDTHVSRLSQRLGLTKEKTPEKIERDLERQRHRSGVERDEPDDRSFRVVG